MARRDECCETCHWNVKQTSDGYIQCYKDREWRRGPEAAECPIDEYKRAK